MEITKNPHAIRESKSDCGIKPIGTKIILKATFEAISMIISSEESLNKLPPVKMEVVAYGEQTHTIEIGDIVRMTARPITIERINIKDNDKSIAQTVRDNNAGKLLVIAGMTHTMYEYFVQEFSDIIGIIEKQNDREVN